MSNEEKNEIINKDGVFTNDNSIYFYTYIDSEKSELFIKKLNTLNNKILWRKVKYNIDPQINVHICSYGGLLDDAIGLSTIITNNPIPINTYVDAYCASGAVLMSVVGNKRYMYENSQILVHQLSAGIWGKFDEHEDNLKNLNFKMDIMKRILLENTEMPKDKIDGILKHDLWISAEEALEYKMIDKIL